MPKDLKEEPKKKIVVVEEVVDTSETDSSNEEKAEDEDVEKTEAPQIEVKKETIQTFEDDQDEKPNYLWIIIPTALLIGGLVGGLITYFSGLSKLNADNPTPSPIPTQTPIVEPTPTATPVSTFKKDELKIQVLNGSGVSGAAGKAKTLLETAGYKNVDTGNASMSDLSQTEIAIKSDKKDYLDTVIKDIAKSYSAIEATKPLAASSKFDIVITIGKK
jgi:hypothetical protein